MNSSIQEYSNSTIAIQNKIQENQVKEVDVMSGKTVDCDREEGNIRKKNELEEKIEIERLRKEKEILEKKVHFSPDIGVERLKNSNIMNFHIHNGSSLLYSLKRPNSYKYCFEEPKWIKFVEAVAVVPSCQSTTIICLLRKAIAIAPLSIQKEILRAVYGDPDDLNETVETLQAKKQMLDLELNKHRNAKLNIPPLEVLRIKDRVFRFFRTYINNPIHGYVFRKDIIYGDYRLDDVVWTPVGKGYLRGYRSSDEIFTVVYSFGYGYIHRSCLMKDSKAHESLKKKENDNLLQQIDEIEPTKNYFSTLSQQEYENLVTSLRNDNYSVDFLGTQLSFQNAINEDEQKLPSQGIENTVQDYFKCLNEKVSAGVVRTIGKMNSTTFISKRKISDLLEYAETIEKAFLDKKDKKNK